MQVLFVILPIAIAMAGVALGAFFWAARGGQFDDLDTPGHRAIFDEPASPSNARATMIRAECPGGNQALDKLTELAGAARQSGWKDHQGRPTPEAVA